MSEQMSENQTRIAPWFCSGCLLAVLAGSLALTSQAHAQPRKKNLDPVSEQASPNQPASGGSEIPLEEKDLDSADKIVAEIDRLTGIINDYLLGVSGDEARVIGPDQMEENDPYPQRQELIWRLYEMDPDHPRLDELMSDRWRAMSNMRTARPMIIGEALKVMENPKAGEDVRATATFWHVLSSIRATGRSPINTAKRLTDQADRFILKYPDDPRGAQLLGYAVRSIRRDPEAQFEIYRRLADEYPETYMGRIGAGKIRQKEAIGKPFELEFTDFRTGDKISTSELSGNVIVIDFFATFCQPCKEELRDYIEMAKTYGEKGVTFLVVSLDRLEDRGGKEALSEFLDETSLQWPVFYQGEGFESDFSCDWGIDSLPATFVVDQQGVLRSTAPGNELDQILDALLKSESNGDKN